MYLHDFDWALRYSQAIDLTNISVAYANVGHRSVTWPSDSDSSLLKPRSVLGHRSRSPLGHCSVTHCSGYVQSPLGRVRIDGGLGCWPPSSTVQFHCSVHCDPPPTPNTLVLAVLLTPQFIFHNSNPAAWSPLGYRSGLARPLLWWPSKVLIWLTGLGPHEVLIRLWLKLNRMLCLHYRIFVEHFDLYGALISDR